MQTLGLGGFSSNGSGVGYEGQNVDNLSRYKSRAVLFVFKPHHRQFGDVAIRSFEYQFDDNFLGKTQEITDLTKNGSASHSAMLNNFMAQTNFNDHLIAGYQPQMQFNASRLSDKWRFILVLTDKGAGLVTNNTLVQSLGGNEIRRIYNGYFEDEPYNPTSFTDTTQSMNPQAFMVITHKSVISSSTEHGMYGSSTSVNAQASELIINPQVSMAHMSHASNNPTLHLMTPENCVNSVETTSDGFAASVPGATSLQFEHGQSSVSDVLEQPKHNVSKIVTGLMMHQDEISARGRLMTNRVDSFYDGDFLEDGVARMNLGRFMSIPAWKPSSIFDLDVNSRISAQDLSNMVHGDLDVVPFDQPKPQFYDTVDQMNIDITNQYSYLIAAVVGPILNAAGMNAMQFVFEVKRSQGQVMEQFQTISAEPHTYISQHDILRTTKAIELELKNGVFATIFNSKGDFRVEVHANATGFTVVRLDLIGMGLRSMADFEIPTCLGGLISPLLGNDRTYVSNSEQITGLYAAATGMQSGTSGFNDDDRKFLDFAENHYGNGQDHNGWGLTNNSPDDFGEVLQD